MSAQRLKSEIAETERTQSVARSMAILRLVLRANQAGLRLQDVVEASGLSKTTAHRLLQELVATEMLRRASGRYTLGRFAWELGVVAGDDFRLQALCEASVARIAEATGDTVFLAVRSGPDAFCIDKRSAAGSGASVIGPPKGFAHPLGVGSAGLAMLSCLAQAQCDSVIRMNEPRMARLGGPSTDSLADMVAQTRRNGYSRVSNLAVPGVTAIGIPIVDRVGNPMVALSVAGRAGRMSGGHGHDVLHVLSSEARSLRERLLGNYATLRQVV